MSILDVFAVALVEDCRTWKQQVVETTEDTTPDARSVQDASPRIRVGGTASGGQPADRTVSCVLLETMTAMPIQYPDEDRQYISTQSVERRACQKRLHTLISSSSCF